MRLRVGLFAFSSGGAPEHLKAYGGEAGSERRAAVHCVVPLHSHVLGFFQVRSVGLLPPRVQRFGVAPHLDGIDPLGIHGVGSPGEVNAPFAGTGARDEITESSDVIVPPASVHEYVAGNDDQGSPPPSRCGAYVTCFMSTVAVPYCGLPEGR